ncbi:MAG: hypothetical protein RLT05_07680 [Bauldia litoralis]
MKDETVREHVNPPRLDRFPDPEDRPAHHAAVQPLGGKLLLQLETIVALRDARWIRLLSSKGFGIRR